MSFHRIHFAVLLPIINFLFDVQSIHAGIIDRSTRMIREVYPPEIEGENQTQVCFVGDMVFPAQEELLAEPCLKCICQPPKFRCEPIQCAKKPGCKAIHRPNKCCPDYQCECQHDGKTYANGEKLEVHPGGECKVCYCRGGEIQCAEVSCYIRKDCEGKRVPGTCCPKYDNCPPIDAVLDRSNSLITETPVNTLKPVVLELWEELSTNATETSKNPITLDSVPEDSNKVPDSSDVSIEQPKYDSVVKKDQAVYPSITIQEIIPEIKEIPVTAPPKVIVSEPQGTLIIEEAIPTGENVSNEVNTDTEPESSEVSEVFQHPPPVLKVGDKLLVLKKSDLQPENDSTTPNIITIIGAEGLQRGGVEENLEVHEIKIKPKNDTDDTNDVGLKSTTESTTVTVSLETSSVTNQEVSKESSTTLNSNLDKPQQHELMLNVTTNVSAETTTDTSVTILLNITTEHQLKQTEPFEQNPAYPPLPDAMPAATDGLQKYEQELESENATMEVKILQDVFDFLGNKTVTQMNGTNAEWLKSAPAIVNGTNVERQKNITSIDTFSAYNALALPEELLKQPSPIDEQSDVDHEKLVDAQLIAEIKLNASVEEELSSQEVTTQKANSSAVVAVTLNENASIEEGKTDVHNTTKEPDDGSILLGSIEVTDDKTTMQDNLGHTDITTTNNKIPMKEDVELINVLNFPLKPTRRSDKIESSTYELLPTPEETKSKKAPIVKREINGDDDIFKDLEKELNAADTLDASTKDPIEEKSESERIFNELMDETSNPPKNKPLQTQTAEQRQINQVSNALSGLLFGKQAPEAGLFRIIGDFFGKK